MRPVNYEKDPEKKKELLQKFLTESVLPHAAIIEKHLVKNGTGFLVGDEVKIIYDSYRIQNKFLFFFHC